MNCSHLLCQTRITGTFGLPGALSCCSSPKAAAVSPPQLPAEAFLLRWCPSGLVHFGPYHQTAVWCYELGPNGPASGQLVLVVQPTLWSPGCRSSTGGWRPESRSTAGLFSAPAQSTSVCGLASPSLRVTFSFPRCLLQASYGRFLSAESLSGSSVGKEHRKGRDGPENRDVVRWRSCADTGAVSRKMRIAKNDRPDIARMIRMNY